VVALLAVLVRELTLARDREHVVLQLDVHVLLGQPGEISAQHVLVVDLHEIHRGDPPPRAEAAVPVRRRRIEERVEQPVHLRLNRVQLAYRLPPYKCHIFEPPLKISSATKIIKSKSLDVKSITEDLRRERVEAGAPAVRGVPPPEGTPGGRAGRRAAGGAPPEG